MAEVGDPLSERELAVLERLVDGSTNREIARDLDISHNTVKVHLRNIFAKLGVSSRTEATTFALQRGLISAPPIVTGEANAYIPQPPMPATELVRTTSPATSDAVPKASRALASWRSISFILLLLTGLLLGVLIGSQLLENAGSNSANGAGTEQEIFTDEPIGQSRWSISKPMPQGRSNMALAAVGLDLFQIGGEVSAGVVNLVDVFETDTRMWRSAAAKPTAVADATAGVLFGEVYVPGGRLADNQPTSVVEAYSPTNNAWRPVAPLPEPLAGALTLTGGGLLYVFGGWDGGAYLSRAYAYDPSLDSWQSLPAMKNVRAFATGGSLSNRFFVVGGYDGQEELAVCEAYDPLVEEWSDCPAMSLPRAGAGAAVLGNNILYVIGGGTENDATYGEAFDAHNASWQRIEIPMLENTSSWHHLGVTHVETRIYAMGGRQDGDIVSANYVFAPFVHQTFLPAVGADN